MSDTLKSITFAAALCLVCSLLLTAAATGFKERQQKNILIDRHKNILQAVGLIERGRTYTPAEIEKRYSDNIVCIRVGDNGRILRGEATGGMQIYLSVGQDEKIRSYIVPIDSRGLWGRILGYLALEDDGSTIAGFTVYQHQETPGLGGEIESAWFQKQFKGKKIVNDNGDFVSIQIAKGSAEDKVPKARQANYVDGISGATLTGKYLTGGLAEILREYEPVSVRFRKHMINKLPADGATCDDGSAG